MLINYDTLIGKIGLITLYKWDGVSLLIAKRIFFIYIKPF